MIYFVDRTKFLKSGGYEFSEKEVFTDEREASLNCYTNITEDMKNDKVSGGLYTVTDSNGWVKVNQKWGTLIEGISAEKSSIPMITAAEVSNTEIEESTTE